MKKGRQEATAVIKLRSDGRSPGLIALDVVRSGWISHPPLICFLVILLFISTSIRNWSWMDNLKFRLIDITSYLYVWSYIWLGSRFSNFYKGYVEVRTSFQLTLTCTFYDSEGELEYYWRGRIWLSVLVVLETLFFWTSTLLIAGFSPATLHPLSSVTVQVRHAAGIGRAGFPL